MNPRIIRSTLVLLALTTWAMAIEPIVTLEDDQDRSNVTDDAGATPADGLSQGAADAQPVLGALEKSGHQFSPEVKAAYLAMRKAGALADLAKAGCMLPEDFLAWVDSNPVVATTVYGLANPGSRATGQSTESRGRQRAVMGADTPAQRLAFLRSLEIDLGAGEVREKHLQLALAFTHFFAGRVNPATLSDDAMKVSLKPRGLFKLEIPGDPRVRIDTRAKDRPLDMNDHIINFCEDNPITIDKKMVTVVNGEKVISSEKQTRPPHAYEVYGNPDMLKKFNAYMTARGFKMDLDCGNGGINPWQKMGGGVIKAYKLFRTAYEEKGLMPKARDPRPAPVELAAYLIRNDNHRFPQDVKRGWPKFNLNSPWPILQWLVTGGESLRERDFVWKRFCATGSVVGYGSYIGAIAQYPDFVKARKLQPFDFGYDTYPMRLKDGGVCGTCSNIGRFSNIGLGVPSAQASQPGHSCLVAIGGNEQRGFSMSVGQSVGNPTFVSGVGRLELASARMVLPVNFGLMPLLDSKIALQLEMALPATAAAKDKKALLLSAFAANPYNLDAVTACLNAQTNPRQLVEFWLTFNDTLAKVDKPGCPKMSSYNTFVIKPTFDALLAKMPPPANRTDVEFVAASLADRSDALWLKYQLALVPLPALKEKLAAGLKASVAGPRTPQGATLHAARLALVGGAITDVAEKKAWANQLLEIIGDHAMFTVGEGKKARNFTDPSAETARILAGNSPDARQQFEDALKSAVAGVRTSDSCNLMVKRLAAIAKDFKIARERKAWADTLQDIIEGHEAYAPPNAPHRPMLDPIVKEIYALGCDMEPVREQLVADLKAAVAGTRTPTTASLLNQRLMLISKHLRNPKQRKPWGEILFGMINGHETFAPNATKPDIHTMDPIVATIYGFGPDLTPAKTKLEADLKAAMAGTRTADASGLLAQRLTAILRSNRDTKANNAWLETTLLPWVVNKEYYTVTLPKNRGAKEVADPCTVLIYRTLGKTIPVRK